MIDYSGLTFVLSEGIELVRHEAEIDWVLSVADSSCGEFMATGGFLDRVYIWDKPTSSKIITLNPDGPGEYPTGIMHIGFHPTRAFFAYIDPEGTLYAYDTNTWNQVFSLPSSEEYAVEFAFDPVHPCLVVGYQTGKVSYWDISTGQCVTASTIPNLPVAVSVSCDSSRLAIVSDEGDCIVVSKECGASLGRLGDADEKIEDGHFAPASPFLLTSSRQGRLACWDYNMSCLRRRDLGFPTNIWRSVVARPTNLYAVRSSDGMIVVWDYNRDIIQAIIHTPSDKVTPICFTNDGRSLLVGGRDLHVRQFSLFLA